VYYGPDERDTVVLPFLEAGLHAGDKCICIVDGVEPTTVVAALPAELDAGQRAEAEQLDVIRSADAYLRSGRFSVPETIAFWKAAITDAMDDGFDVVRAVAVWSGPDVIPDAHEILLLESQMGHALAAYPHVVLCLYDVSCFGGGVVVDLLRTQPRLLVRGVVFDNPYYVSVDELLDDEDGP
jgi:hypothetical protein